MKRLTGLSKPLLRFAPEETEAGRKEILGANLGRLIYLLYVGVPLMAAELAFISYKFSGATGQLLQWRTGATTIHLTLLIFNLITGAGILLIRKRNLAENPLVKIIPHFVFIYFIAAGIAFTTVDQMITTAITPFVITCLISAMVLIISPFITAIYYTLAYIAFYLAISRMQLPQETLISNLINGFTSIVIGWSLSAILWRNFLQRFRTVALIRQQQSELQIQNKELNHMVNELRQLNTSRSKLFSVISHDLRGPINNLGSILELLKNKNISLSDFEKAIPELTDQTKETSDFLENLLNWSKNNLGGYKNYPELLAINDITTTIIKLYESHSQKKGLKVVNETESWHVAMADPGMVSLVIRNFLANAIKFSKTGGEIVIYSTLKNNELEIGVIDSGIGIDSDRIPLLFTDEQRSTRGTAGETGTGLGLQLCKEFVERNGGRIGVESKKGEGSRFWFTLPDAEKE